MRIFHERRAGVLKNLDCSSSADRREVFQEDFKWVASLQVLEQDSHWHARANEHGRATHDFEV
jgi:hypothetical protein